MIAPWLLLALMSSLADDTAYQEGLRLYREVEFEQALFRFQEAATVPGRPDPERVELFCWLGMTYAALERDEAADRAFHDALRLDVEAALPADAPPKLRERFTQLREVVRKELAAAPAIAEEPEPELEPVPALDPPAPGAFETTPLLFASAGVAGAAAVVAATAGGLAVALAFQSVAIAENVSEFQDVRIASVERANVQLGIGYGLFAAGGAMALVAGGLGGAALVFE